MHKMTGWTARRSGPQMTVRGYDESGNAMKISAVSVEGPSKSRVLAPESTVAIQPDGTPIELI